MERRQLCWQRGASYVEQEMLLSGKIMEHKATEQLHKAKADYKAIFNKDFPDRHAFYPYLQELC